MKEEVHKYFNETNKYLHRSFGVRLRSDIVRGFIGNVKNTSILDAGCGDGGVSIQFLESNNITFCDLSENMLERVSEQIPSIHAQNATIVHSAIEQFKTEQKFDYIFCIGVLAHVPSVYGCIEHLLSLLDFNGKLVLQFSDYNHWLTKLSVSIAGYDYRVNKIRHNDLEEILNKLNMKIEKRVQYNFMLPGMGKLPDSLLYKVQRLTVKYPSLGMAGTEHIWMLSKMKG